MINVMFGADAVAIATAVATAVPASTATPPQISVDLAKWTAYSLNYVYSLNCSDKWSNATHW